MKKKTIGIVLIVIAVLNMLAWIPDAQNGKSEGALYYVFVLAILVLGIWLVANSKKLKDKSIK